jgi:hypothetical protein
MRVQDEGEKSSIPNFAWEVYSIPIVLVSKLRLSIVVGTSTSRNFAIDDDLQEEAKV